MIDKDFIPPAPEISRAETAKRKELINWFKEEIRPAVSSMIVLGSMGSGQDYSVSPTSDIDSWLIVDKTNARLLAASKLFNPDEISHAVGGYLNDHYRQFSLNLIKDGITIECHFWDEDALIAAMTYQSQNTKRLRTGIDKPSTDYAYSFDRYENAVDFYGEMSGSYPVGDFNSFRIVNDKLYLCRPITNVLKGIINVFCSQRIESAIEECWKETVKRLKSDFMKHGSKPESAVDLERFNIFNALPGKNKISKDSAELIRAKTEQFLNGML